MGEKPLTWQQVLAVLCCLPLFAAVVVAILPDATPKVSAMGWAATALFSLLFVLLLISHWRKIHRRDNLPDILSELFERPQIFQVGAVHFFITAKQRHLAMRVVVVVQNLRDGSGRFSLALRAGGQAAMGLSAVSTLLSKPVPLGECDLSPGCVTLLQIDVPLEPLHHNIDIRLWMTPRAAVGGRDVRFGRREAVRQRTSMLLTILAAAAGRLHYGGGTYLDVPCHPVERAPLTSAESVHIEEKWTASVLWTPDNRTNIDQIRALVSDAIGDPIA